MQDQIDQDALAHEELREQFSLNERKYTILHAEFEETRAALDTNERASMFKIIYSFGTPLTSYNSSLSPFSPFQLVINYDPISSTTQQ